MSTPFLTTKLYIPKIRPDLVPRHRLVERLNQGVNRKLTLISAPAGFGKTTLLSDWVHQSNVPVAWVSLDKGDNHQTSFLVYFVAALNTIEAGHFESIQTMLQAPQPTPLESILTELINEVANVSQDFVLILDDYHVVEAQPIHDALTFLLEHLPPVMHVVIASRSDPLLKIPRLRAHGQMTELRVKDLRFSTQEAAIFLNQVMGLSLSEADVSALESRTEGWIAGLQLAALSMQGRMQSGENTAAFISAFTGDDRYIVDYLVDEVLAQRPKGTQDFLLQTSILDRMTGSLCDAVTCQEGGQNVLEMLEQTNLFIVPLDNRRQWYRYHHLFADLLRQRFEESTAPEETKLLHQRASLWYEENNFLVESVEHSLAAEDHENVVRLISSVGGMELLMRSQAKTMLRWQAELPQDLVASQPMLCMIFAWAWVATGHPEEAERYLRVIEQTLGTEMEALFSEKEETQEIDSTTRAALVEIAVLRAELAIERGDIPEVLKLSNLVLSYLEEDERTYFFHPPNDSRMVILFIMGLAHKIRGELDQADSALSEAAVLGQELGNVHVVAGAYGRLASVQDILGHLRQAIRTCHQGLQLVQELVGERSPMSGMIHAELGHLLYEQNNLEAALHHLQKGIDVAKPWNLLEAFASSYTGLAMVRAAQGDLDRAFAALDELVELGKSNPSMVKPAEEPLRALLWVKQGKTNDALQWVKNTGLNSEEEINYYQLGEFMVLVRVLTAQGAHSQAIELIGRMMDVAEAAGWFRLVIELRILLALALKPQGETEQALRSLEIALTLAESEGYVRVFLDEGQSMESLLRDAETRKIASEYVAELLVAFEQEGVPGAPPSVTTLIDPLSERELEVLSLLKTELSGPEIAEELTIALSTVRTHTKSIYSKLDVNNRRAAVIRAEELDLI